MIDVLICGAGPSGLHLAAQLIRRGLVVRVIDKSPTPSDKSKAIIVHARTLEILEELGLADTFIESGLIYKYLEIRNEHELLVQVHLNQIPSKYNYILATEQSKTEAILIDYLKTQNFEVEREVELLSVNPDKESVKFTLRNNRTGEVEESESSWLVGCDGAHSTVRKAVNLSFSGMAFHQIISLADIEVEWKYPPEVGYGFLTEKGIFFALPINKNHRYRLLFTLDRLNSIKNVESISQGIVDSSIASPPTMEEIQHLVRKVADPEAMIKNPVWLSNFKLSSRVVNEFNVGRVFLVGDSAHVHSPLGGQGMNTGLQDGYNLAWKLAMVHKNQAYDSLLESYTLERHENALKLLSATEKGTKAMLLQNHWKMLFNHIMHFMGSLNVVKQKIANLVSQLAVNYSKSAWIVQKFSTHIKTVAGHRAPNAKIVLNGEEKRLFELWKDDLNYRLLLIDYSGQNLQKEEMKTILKEEYRDLIHPLFITEDEDIHYEIRDNYGDKTVYLIRPDGYVGYCGPLKGLDDLYRYLDQIIR